VTANPSSDRDDRLADAVCEFLSSQDSGRPLAPADWLARHPDLAHDLQEFVGDPGGFEALLRALGPADRREIDLDSDERFLGDCELRVRVGGRMGVVYRAWQSGLGRDVAVKVLARTSPEARAQFRVEARAVAGLLHPNIVRILTVSRPEEVPFFSMEWYPGGTLADHLDRYVADPDLAARVVAEIARAVHFAHARGFLHRDLKPANILLDAAGRPCVADFGLAVLLKEPTDPAGRAGAGTPAYMAPEQVNGEVTVATDVHGLGTVLYALLTGRAPFDGDELTDVLDRVQTAAPIAPRVINPRVDPDLEAVCIKCLEKDPARRYASAVAVADDLDRFLVGDPVVANSLGVVGRVAHALRQARSAAEFRRSGPALAAQAGVVFLNNSIAFLLLQAGAAEVLLWAAVFASYLPLLALGLRDSWRSPGRPRPGVRHLWAVGVGHAAAALAGFVAHRLLAGDDPVRWMGGGYITCAAVNAALFTVLGSLFTGRLYLLGAFWIGAAVVMAAVLPWAPLIYAGLIAGSSLLTAAHLRGLAAHDRDPAANPVLRR
jgi:serine/threonine-protein kinase